MPVPFLPTTTPLPTFDLGEHVDVLAALQLAHADARLIDRGLDCGARCHPSTDAGGLKHVRDPARASDPSKSKPVHGRPAPAANPVPCHRFDARTRGRRSYAGAAGGVI